MNVDLLYTFSQSLKNWQVTVLLHITALKRRE